jgi:hypothetical protein
MKRYVTIALLAIAPLAAGAATERSNTDDDRNRMSIRVGGYEVQFDNEEDRQPERQRHGDHRNDWRRRNYHGSIGTLEVGFNQMRTFDNSYLGYSNEDRGFMDLDIARSVNATLNVFTFSSALTPGNWLGVSMALGANYNQYTLLHPVAFERGTMLRPVRPELPLKRSKLRTVSIHVPMVLEINPARNFFLAGGAYADLVVWSDIKWKYPKVKMASPGVEFLQVGLTARAGFRDFYVLANYSIGELFKKGSGPRLSPFTFGLGFGF